MSRSSFLVAQDTLQIHQTILNFYIQKADRFRAYFPEGDFLSGSRVDFLALEGVSVQPWLGMVGCIIVEGSLTPAARALIQERGKNSDGDCDEDSYYHPLRLWSYELVDETEVLLQITDFSVWRVFASLEEVQSLEKQKIPISEWQEASFELQEGETILRMNEGELEQLTQAIEKEFFPRHE